MADTRGRQVVVPATNKSGGALAIGDVVIVDTGNNTAVTTTSSGRSETSVGVCQSAAAADATVLVLLAGYAALINVPASVTRGHYIETHTVAKQATGNSSRRSGSFGQFLTGGTSPTGILWGQTDQTASGGATPPDCEEAFCSADTAITSANTWTDITGATMSLAAGDWNVTGIAYADDANSAATYVELAIHNGTTQVASVAGHKPAGAGNTINLSVAIRLTLGGTTTVKLQGASARASSSTIFRTTATLGTGGVANKAISIRAVKVTSI